MRLGNVALTNPATPAETGISSGCNQDRLTTPYSGWFHRPVRSFGCLSPGPRTNPSALRCEALQRLEPTARPRSYCLRTTRPHADPRAPSSLSDLENATL